MRLVKNIVELPLNDRPYEKLERLGSENLTNSELLAILIRNGTKEQNCLDIAQSILSKKENMSKVSDIEFLTNLSLEELKSFQGIGRVKAIQIKAVVELSKRMSDTYLTTKDKISSPNDVYRLLGEQYKNKKQECLKTVLLNKGNKVLSVVTNSIGNNDRIEVGMKEIFSEPIKQMACSIILVHNHPSGTLCASKADIEFTKRIQEYATVFNIQLLDHIIITNDGYVSLKEQGKI